jgi:glycosyltransferase involved in cell wall biosynthesis
VISIIVPAFNESATVGAVIDRLLTVPLPATREIIVINDGSSDGTREVLERYAGAESVRVVHAVRNRGKGYAIRLGIATARGDVVAIQDADLELDPAQIGELVAPILAGEADVVYGSRFLSCRGSAPNPGSGARGGPFAPLRFLASRPDVPRVTVLANWTLTALTNILYGSSLTDMETCYKIMRTGVARSLELSADRFDIEPEITARLLRAGHRILELPVRFNARSRAAGKKIGWRDGVSAVRTLVRHRFTARPRP